MSSLKERKEQFVSGLAGGTTAEIYAVTSVALVAYAVWSLVQTRTSLWRNGGVGAFLADFGLNWGGLLLAITLYGLLPLALSVGLAVPAVVYVVTSEPLASPNRELPAAAAAAAAAKRGKNTVPNALPKHAYLTVYRLGMIIITCLAILAVDFEVFPRRFAKVETWGTLLMDLGVGSFVFSMGLVSSRAVIKRASNPQQLLWGQMVLKLLRDALPLLVLGAIRLVLVKNLDYQEHVSEYGVHWNFFFTLGFLPPMLALLEPVMAVVPRVVVALLCGYVYELCLFNVDGLRQYILLAPRVDLLSANKEGVFLFVGYLLIFLSGQSCGWFLLPSAPTPGNFLRPISAGPVSWFARNTTILPTTGLLLFSFGFHALLSYLNHHYLYGVLRRLANFPYVIWVNAYNTTFLLGFRLVEQVFFGSGLAGYDQRVPASLEAINRNGLAVFLLANLLTGAVNMSINTLDALPATAIAVLAAYALTIAATAAFLHSKRLYIKL